MLETVQEVRKLLVYAQDAIWKSCFGAFDASRYTPLLLDDTQNALADMLSFRPDVICLSYSFFIKKGLAFFSSLLQNGGGIPIVLLCETDDLTISDWIITQGGFVISGNPAPDFISLMLERCLEKAPQKHEKAPETPDMSPFDTFIGETEEVRSLKQTAARFALSSLPVLITGETGTGKTFIAEAVHKASKRAGKPFVVENMAEVQEGIAENILFGSVRGAFTSAETRPGLFEAADGGTLFLDEITEMASGVQAKLLRVLGQNMIQRVGGSRQVPVDVRLIAASNRDLPSEVESGRFRLDLYYRIAPLTLRIPPLRERKEDIPLLINHFLMDTDKAFSRGALEKLLSHTWPGNVRELSGCIKRCILMSTTKIMTESDVSFLPAVIPCCHQ